MSIVSRICSSALFAVFIAAACTRQLEPGHSAEATNPSGRYPEGSVGYEASQYRLTMEGVRRWYGAAAELHWVTERNPTFLMRIDFPFDSELKAHVHELESIPEVANTLAEHDLSAEEFIFLTVFIGIGWAATIDERVAVDPALLEFFRRNMEEIQELNERIGSP